ncbi:MAG: AI-2E family transporter [Oscillospiraceae bacterium]|nr:AI-2E family transporter [Oscillospiraceae bacterium]
MTRDRIKDYLLYGAFFAGCLLFVYLVGRYVISWFLPLIFGFLIAYALRPMAGLITRHSSMSGRGAAIASAFVFYLVVGVLIWMLGAYLFGKAREFGERLPEFYQASLQPTLETMSARIGEVTGERRLAGPIGRGATGALDLVNQALGGAASSASARGMELLGSGFSKLPITAIAVIFTILSSVLICAEYDKVSAGALRLIPEKARGLVLETRDYLLQTLGRTLKAYLILGAITFAGLSIGLWLLDVNRFLIMAAIIALLDFLPILGSGAVLLPWSVYFLLTGQTGKGLGMIALWVAVSVIRETLEPRILGKQIGLHPLAAVTAMYAGLKIIGLWGLVLAPILCLLVRYLYQRGVFASKQIPPDVT